MIWGTGHTERRERCAIRGGDWNNGASAGVFNLNFNNPRSNVNWNIGGRPALPFAGYEYIASRGHVGARAKGVRFPFGAANAGKNTSMPHRRKRQVRMAGIETQ
jgi:hypothetical protein